MFDPNVPSVDLPVAPKISLHFTAIKRVHRYCIGTAYDTCRHLIERLEMIVKACFDSFQNNRTQVTQSRSYGNMDPKMIFFRLDDASVIASTSFYLWNKALI